jgi:glycogen operon protein
VKWRDNRQDPNWSGHRWRDLIIYEVHLKGITASPASGVEHPGTYRGLGEKADYLADLGITAVELMPVHEKPLDGGYWGYQTLSFFAPELSYASKRQREEVIDEFKWMVDQLHQHGIEVLLDVVYNHTGEGGLWREKIEQDDVALDPDTDVKLASFDPKEVAGLYCYRGLDNRAYYALSEDGQTYWNNSGVGNETRCNHRPMRRLIMDSLRFWVEQMHVDGFRFDLAPVMGEVDNDHNTWDDPANTVIQEIIDDPLLSKYNTRIIAEPWSLAHFRLGAFPRSSEDAERGWYEWNAHFRDVWRSFVNTDDRPLNAAEGPVDIGASLTGSNTLLAHNGRRPYPSVNFVTCHDGFPMYDLFSYDTKLNGCGVLNPTCCDERLSPFCDKDSGESHNRSRDWGQDNEPQKRQLMRNMFVAMMIAHGTPMLLGGDEWMRTQLGNNNAYSTGADNHWNWFAWGTWQPSDERTRMHDFVRQAIRFRKDNAHAFAPADYEEGAPFSWKTAANQDMGPDDWGTRHLMIHYYDASAGPQLAILINMETVDVDFTLPEGQTWQRLIDTQAYFDSEAHLETVQDKRISANITLDKPTDVPETNYVVKPRSMVVLKARP